MKPNDLEQQVARARRRLWINRWLGQLGWTLTAAACAFLLAVVVERLFHVGVRLSWAAVVAAGAAVMASFVWLLIRHEDPMSAAQALDAAVGLRERVTTGLYCAGSTDPFAQSVYADAVQSVRSVTVERHLPVRYPRSLNWAWSSTIAALLVLWLMPSYDLLGLLAKQRDQEKKRKALETTQVAVQQTVERVKQLAESGKMIEEMKELSELTDMASEKPMEADELRREAIKRIEKLSDRLKERQESAQYDEVQEFKKMMRRLGDREPSETPVNKLRQSLAKGDFKAATEAIKEMQEQLAKSKAPEDQAKVAEMKKQLANLAKEMEKLASQDRLKEEMKKSGLSEEEAKRLLENLSKKDMESVKKDLEKQGLSKEQIEKLMKEVAKNKAASAKCKGLSGALSAAAKGMQQGQSDLEAGNAAGELTKASEQLSEMEMAQQEMMDMQATLSELSNCKGGLCDGQGEGEGEGEGMGEGSEGMGQGGGLKTNNTGGLGQGQGGRTPTKQTKTAYKPDRVRGKESEGAIIGRVFVDGEQMTGQAREKAAEVAASAAKDATEAMDRQRVPRVYRDPVKKYFGKIQQGVGKPAPTTQP
ncbi:MAG: hypothetical protein JXQ73_21535 [Phycisphaerae bacterium]|nr:hypothetical protein [Phycisphaerae bacterium]